MKCIPLIVAMSAALLASACDRDAPTPAADEPAPSDMATAPAPTPEPLPAPAPAPDGAAPVDSGLAFVDMDVNKDGGLTLDELADTEMLHQHFGAADTDGNGQLSSLEVDTHRAQMAGSP